MTGGSFKFLHFIPLLPQPLALPSPSYPGSRADQSSRELFGINAASGLLLKENSMQILDTRMVLDLRSQRYKLMHKRTVSFRDHVEEEKSFGKSKPWHE